jgi:hypothetical protein
MSPHQHPLGRDKSHIKATNDQKISNGPDRQNEGPWASMVLRNGFELQRKHVAQLELLLIIHLSSVRFNASLLLQSVYNEYVSR